LLLSEPERGDPSKVMQAIKQGFARRLLRGRRAGAGCPTSRLVCGKWADVDSAGSFPYP